MLRQLKLQLRLFYATSFLHMIDFPPKCFLLSLSTVPFSLWIHPCWRGKWVLGSVPSWPSFHGSSNVCHPLSILQRTQGLFAIGAHLSLLLFGLRCLRWHPILASLYIKVLPWIYNVVLPRDIIEIKASAVQTTLQTPAKKFLVLPLRWSQIVSAKPLLHQHCHQISDLNVGNSLPGYVYYGIAVSLFLLIELKYDFIFDSSQRLPSGFWGSAKNDPTRSHSPAWTKKSYRKKMNYSTTMHQQ